MTKEKSREKIIEGLKLAEMEEGRTGLVAEYLATHPEVPKDKKKRK